MLVKVFGTAEMILTFVFIFVFFGLFYHSVKLCFGKNCKKKVRLFLLTVFTNPLCCLLTSIVLMGGLCVLLPFMPHTKEMFDVQTNFQVGVIVVGSSIIYLFLTLGYGLWAAKFLKVEKKGPVIFLYVIYNATFSALERQSASNKLFGVDGLNEVLDFFGSLVMFAGIWFLYRLVIRALAKMTWENVKIRWGVFITPPLIVLTVYSMFYIAISYVGVTIDDTLVVTIHLFSDIITFTLIWAFYVIIKTINATTEAVKAKDEVKELSVEVMEALAHTIDAKDEYTKGHSVRVAKYSRLLAEKLGLSPEECESVYYMGLLHDIGKIGVPNAIINSTSKLTDEEYAIIKTHPSVGYDILQEIHSRPDLSIGARWHHERYDGKGYPDGKAGTDIPYLARIIAVADSYDAMTSNRSYRKYLPQEVVRSEIEKNFGKQFDEDIAKCMLSVMDEDVNYELHE